MQHIYLTKKSFLEYVKNKSIQKGRLLEEKLTKL